MRLTTLAAIILTLSLCAVAAHAQEPSGAYKVDYFDNAHTTGAPDATVRITNPGTAGAGICANIFVFNTDEELQQCCACPLVPNGLRKLSVNNDLTSHPLTGVTLTSGTIEIVSTAQTATGQCEAPYNLKPIQALSAWATHIQDSSFTVTESPSQDATLSQWEISTLGKQCGAINRGTTGGPCTCGTGN
jgi:hypothetical protein